MSPCAVCPPQRARVPHRPLVCDGCRTHLAAQLAEIPELVAELTVRALVVDDAPQRNGRDPVADELPAASIASRRGQRVTGTRDKPAPLNLDVVDLTARARVGTVHDPLGDQIGEHPAATVLAAWVVDLRAHRAKQECLPVPTVSALTAWLAERLDDAADDFPAIGDLAGEVRRLRAVLRAQLGLVGFDDEPLDGIACPKCDHRGVLCRPNGSDHIECGACGVLLTFDEYARWTRLLAANITWLRGRSCPSCGLGRLYTFRGFPEIRCGWCDTTRESAA